MVKSLQSSQNYSRGKWCVDSGANRDICRDVRMAKGKAIPKKHRIGEAGRGHSFTSEAEGPISFSVQGKPLPLFNRTIFAEQIGENIMSVSEAVDKGYAMLFRKEGVTLYPKDVKVRGAAILSGKRDTVNNLFYIELPDVASGAPANLTANLANLSSQACSSGVSPFKLIPVSESEDSPNRASWFGGRSTQCNSVYSVDL